jgi:protease I
VAELAGKRVIVITAHEFEDVEVLYPVLRLSEAGAFITVATLPKDAFAHFHARTLHPTKPITGRFGSTVPFIALAEGLRYEHVEIRGLHAADYDAVVVPGGFAPDFLRVDEPTMRFVAEMHRAGKWVSAICHGPQLLISTDATQGTDIVRGRKVAGVEMIRDDLRNAGGDVTDAAAVVDGNVITSRCPDDLPEYCLAIIDALSGALSQGIYGRVARPTRRHA